MFSLPNLIREAESYLVRRLPIAVNSTLDAQAKVPQGLEGTKMPVADLFNSTPNIPSGNKQAPTFGACCCSSFT